MFGSGWEALPEVRERSESIPEVRECSGAPPGWSGGPPGCPEVVWTPYRMSRSGREAHLDGWEALPDVRKWSGDPPGCPGVVERTFQMSGSCWEALLDVRDWTVGPPGNPVVVGRPS